MKNLPQFKAKTLFGEWVVGFLTDNENIKCENGLSYRIDHKTISFVSEFHDESEKPVLICENDILERTTRSRLKYHKVEFYKGAFRCNMMTLDKFLECETAVVAGNIFDNFTLLK